MSLLLAIATRAPAQTESDDELSRKSLPLRTALHHDPTLEAPLGRLITMYREVNKVPDLLNLYRAHLQAYPQDARAHTVLIRLMEATGDPATVHTVRVASQQFPDDPYLHFLHYRSLRKRNDAGALDELDKAIALEKRPARKAAWIDLLLPAAEMEARRELAEKHLQAVAQELDDADQLLELARKMNRSKFYELAAQTLARPTARPPSPETMVSIELEAAAAEMGLDKSAEARARLDALLGKLTADYWRRGEIVRRRLAIVTTDEERQRLIADARQRVADHPNDEAAVLDLVQVLAGLQYRRDALQACVDGSRQLPQSPLIEKRALELFDRLRDEHGREAYLADRIGQQPERKDLMRQHTQTLFLLGRRADALARWDETLADLSKSEKAAQHLEMARFLRRSSLAKDAAELFRRALQLEPARLDVWRELGECYLVLEDRAELRNLFTTEFPEEATLENLFDLVQFMIAQELFAEARTALRGRLTRHATNLDIRVMLLKIESRLGNRAGGLQLIGKMRDLADTGARYRKWLESAAAFHEEFDSLSPFLDAELNRLALEPAEWNQRRLERRLAFADTAIRADMIQQVTVMLDGDLATDPPREYRLALRRQLIRALESDRTQFVLVQQQLQDLAKDEPHLADEANARLALLHASLQRFDLAMPLLEGIDVTRINDPAILRGIQTLLAAQPSGRQKMLAVLERLTVLNPTERGVWEQWLTALGASGDEVQLRRVIRQLLAGIDKMPISKEATVLLEEHLADSYWRSIVRRLMDGESSALTDAIVLLDSVEQMASRLDRSLWIAWIRAYVLNRLGRPKARDQAITELEALVARGVDGSEPLASEANQILFPDGLTISLDHARRVLSNHVPREQEPISTLPRQGSLPSFKVKWVADVAEGVSLEAVTSLDDKHLLACLSTGDVDCLARESGKLLWSHKKLLPTSTSIQHVRVPMPHHPNTYTQQQRTVSTIAVEPLSDGEGRFFIPEGGRVSCYRSADGELLWRVHTGIVWTTTSSNASAAGVPVNIFLHQGALLVFDAVTGTLARIDRTTGKVVSEQALTGLPNAHITSKTSGASLFKNRLMIYGSKTAIIDLDTGETQWSIEPNRVRPFPVALNEPGSRAAQLPSLSSTPVVWPSLYAPTPNAPSAQYVSGMGYPGQTARQPQYYAAYPQGRAAQPYVPGGRSRTVSYHSSYSYPVPTARTTMPRSSLRLAPPAVAWASGVNASAGRSAHLLGRRLLLVDHTGLQILHTDLPLAGQQLESAGNLIGVTGGVACFAAADGLRFVDVRSGRVRQFQLPQTDHSSQPVKHFLFIDGPLIYITGTQGLTGVNALTARRVFSSPWPEEVVDAAASLAVAAPAATSQFYAPAPQPSNVATHSRRVGCAEGGTLYALSSPTRLVALSGQQAND